MAFLINCPNCGERGVDEFRIGGEVTQRPEPNSSSDVWSSYFYDRSNLAGEQKEWWYHRLGCRKWMVAERDTTTNKVISTSWP